MPASAINRTNARDELRTARLLLRRWREADREPLAAMNADPVTMASYPRPLTRSESDAFAARVDGYFAQRGFGHYVVEVPGVAPFVGFAGLTIPPVDIPILHGPQQPVVEIAWRFAREHGGKGYAAEACNAVLAHAFDDLGIALVMTYTTPDNQPGRRAAERIGMITEAADDFDHPDLPPGHPQRRKIVLKITSDAFELRQRAGSAR